MSLATVRGEFVLKSGEAADMAALIKENLEGLRQRSVYALAQQDVSKPGKSLRHALYRIAGSNTLIHIKFRNPHKTHMPLFFSRWFYR